MKWIVYCKAPFAGPEQVLRYLSRYTHRVAIANRRLVSVDGSRVAFRWKNSRIEGAERWKTMTLDAGEFIRRFLIHVLPKGLQRIRHYGFLANGNRAAGIARARELLAVPKPEPVREPKTPAARHRAAHLADTVPVLWRANVRHRGLRARHNAEASCFPTADQDRHIMSALRRCRRHLQRSRIAAGVEMTCAGAHRAEPMSVVSAHSGGVVEFSTAPTAHKPTLMRDRTQTIRLAVRPQSP